MSEESKKQYSPCKDSTQVWKNWSKFKDYLSWPFFSYIPFSEIRNQLRAKKHKFYSIITCCCVFWIPFFWRIGWLWWNLEYFQRKSWCKSIFQATILKQNDNGYLICLVPWLSENDWKKWMKLERTLFFIEYWNKSHQFIIIAFTH